MKEKDNNFGELHRLLKLKRNEVPPPGYFDNFSGQVIARIQNDAGGLNSSFVEKLEGSAPWLLNFLRVFEAKPGIIGAAATACCLLLVGGVILSERADNAQKTVIAGTDVNQSAATPNLVQIAAPLLANAETSGGITATTNTPNLQPLNGIFGQPVGQPLFQQVSYPVGNH